MRLGLVVVLVVGCGQGDEPVTDGGTASDAIVNDAAVCSPGPLRAGCGCPDTGRCISLQVTDWVDDRVIGAGEGLTAYLVSYESGPPALAAGTPDAAGTVVFDLAAVPAGETVMVMLDDDADAAEDLWAPTSLGPLATDGVIGCVDAPAVTRARGDIYLADLGFAPTDNVGGMVILELTNACGQPSVGVGLQTHPEGVTGYFSPDRLRVSPSSGTTSAGAVLTVASTYCSPSCLNITCACSDPNCGPRVDVGGQTNGFHFARMRCDAP